ncbi:uncharacterized protein LOC129215280 [Grus americana]|uniref:uncharacterized protein LOC129215280 n=1 Tax=Grus americana TaxID=9117 RepID=UPI00240864E3|nr:uncharacterized protein LOC129215280 [Grus americana]
MKKAAVRELSGPPPVHGAGPLRSESCRHRSCSPRRQGQGDGGQLSPTGSGGAGWRWAQRGAGPGSPQLGGHLLSTSVPSPEVLHLPAAGRLGQLPGPALPLKLPLPPRQRGRLQLPFLRGVQVSVPPQRAGARAEDLPPPSRRSCCTARTRCTGGCFQQHGQTPCLVCLEAVAGRPTYDTLVCPACASAWFHRRCIQGQALWSALHYFCCPLCRDMATFQAEMFRLGIKIPDRVPAG